MSDATRTLATLAKETPADDTTPESWSSHHQASKRAVERKATELLEVSHVTSQLIQEMTWCTPGRLDHRVACGELERRIYAYCEVSGARLVDCR